MHYANTLMKNSRQKTKNGKDKRKKAGATTEQLNKRQEKSEKFEKLHSTFDGRYALAF